MPSALSESIQASFWQRTRYNVFGRGIPAVLFGYFAWLQLGHLQAAVGQFQTWDWYSALGLCRGALYLLFSAMPAAIYLTRPIPLARDGRLLPRIAAFTGTLMLLAVGAYFPAGPILWTAPKWMTWVQLLLLLASTAFAVWSLLYLRRNLSIIPEARKLVSGGPYRLVRHPIYLAEITAAGSLLIVQPRLVSMVAWLVFVPIQLLRTRYEEALLALVFPEYSAFASQRKRLVPWVW